MKKFLSLLLLLCIVFVAFAEDEQALYDRARDLYNTEKYIESAKIYESLGDFKNSKTLYTQSMYRQAISLIKVEKYADALDILNTMPKYKDAQKYIKRSQMGVLRQDYARAEELFSQEKYQEALDIYKTLRGFSKSKERIKQAEKGIAYQNQLAKEERYFAQALALQGEGKLQEAREAFIEAGAHEGATEAIYAINKSFALENQYKKAGIFMQSKQYGKAYQLFRFLQNNSYKDSAELADKAYIAYNAELYDSAQYCHDKGYIVYSYLGDYKDSPYKLKEIKDKIKDKDSILAASEQYFNNKEYELAQIGYEICLDIYNDLSNVDNIDYIKNRIAESKDLQHKEQTLAHAIYLSEIWELEESNKLLASLQKYGDAHIIMSGNRYFTAEELRDYRRSEPSAIYTATDGSRHQYSIYKGVRLWQEARRFCEALGGHLATISDEEENSYIHDYMIDCGYTEAFFGLSDEHRTGDWVWVTDEDLKFSNWAKGEPSRSPRERYGMFFTTILKPRTWNDSHFYEHAEHDPGCSFICEWDIGD